MIYFEVPYELSAMDLRGCGGPGESGCNSTLEDGSNKRHAQDGVVSRCASANALNHDLENPA